MGLGHTITLPPLFESSAANDAFINSFGTRKTSFDGVYASKADEFYLKALQKYEPKDALANAAPAAAGRGRWREFGIMEVCR